MSFEENNLITFKLYVFKNQKPTEIRKFSLKTNELSFENMEENLLSIFPNLKDLKYTLLWKDQEEDFITLSTSKEFTTFEAHVTKIKTSEEIKIFINFEDELFAVSQNFEQSRLSLNFSCNVCQKKLTQMCVDCTSKNTPQERKILNVTKQPSVKLSLPNENGDVKPPTTFTASNESSFEQPTLNTSTTSAPTTFANSPATRYQFGSKFSDKGTFAPFGPPTSLNNFK